MPLWSCPHCGASQPATARCWVCHRSSTTCSTCRHFRASLAADLGYCGLDPKRRPLTGLELRGCWTEAITGHGQETPATASRDPSRPDEAGWVARHAARGFVPVGELDAPPVRQDEPAEPDGVPLLAMEAAEAWDARTSLFGELEA